MKQVTFAVGLLTLGLAVGLAMPGVLAQAQQSEVQQWEQFCELHKWAGKGHIVADKANPSAAAHGKDGYQLVTSASAGLSGARDLVLCYRRPAR